MQKTHKESKKEESKEEFEQRLTLIHEERKNIELKHKNRMEELIFERENQRLNHERILERGRISRAEDRKMFLEKKSLRG